ncbi:GTPase [Streptomonospora salina]|uniref:GTP-binding protein EngB required for normal cell division n=1 Tax=Streptomonospora salina TaxID=104205 RepID=A0A841EIV7_9ACTN|nr:GTPase [Streptomonospora salina]MBB6000290.1 GTP-binding protein EngB required for normal cell division [Streptomonospora salina]
MTTHWNAAHADEDPEAAGNREAGRPDSGGASDSGHDARSGDRPWNGYVVPGTDRIRAGWAPPGDDSWPESRPVGPPAAAYPALRRAVDQQSGAAGPEDGDPDEAGGASQDDAPTGPIPEVRPEHANRRYAESGTEPPADRSGAAAPGTGPEREPLPKRPVRRSADESGPRRARHEKADDSASAGDPGSSSDAADASQHGRHSAAPPEPAAPADGSADPSSASAEGAGRTSGEGDPDDPDRLADWVGSLADLDETNMIAGRRTGPMPVVDPVEGAPAGSAAAAGPDPEGERSEGPTGSAAERAAGTSAGSGTATSAGPDAGAAPAPARTDAPEPRPAARPEAPGADTGSDDEYRPSAAGEPWEPMPAVTREELITRLDAVSALVGIGADDFSSEVVDQAQNLLDHAGARLRLSGEHTVVALAGGTGSGKSSLFNALCGLDFSRVGITRPTTSDTHACVWGNEGAEGLLSWVGVPRRNRHSRTSELDKSDSELSGLILLDLPDHDSVRSEHTAEADRLIGSCDLLVWVLDPQKYADAAVHHRYFAEMTGHGAVTVAVLNQVDRVAPDELEELLTDLRRLLETESGVHPRVVTTSTATGQGIGTLRSLLAETVTERRALIDRLVADLDRVVAGFERYHGDPDGVGTVVPDRVRSALVEGLVEAGGAAGVADTAESAYRQRGERRVGWPVARWANRLRRDPLSAVSDGFAGGADTAAPVEAYGAGIDKAAVDVARQVAGSLPAPWPRRVRAAARSGLDVLPRELSEAVASSVPAAEETPTWWRVVHTLQYVLLGLAGAGIVWFGTVLASWLAGGLTGVPVVDAPIFLGFAAAMAVATPAAGWLLGTGSSNLIEVSAAQRRELVEQRSSQRARELAEQRILAPVEQELAHYVESCRALATAQGPRG